MALQEFHFIVFPIVLLTESPIGTLDFLAKGDLSTILSSPALALPSNSAFSAIFNKIFLADLVIEFICY